MAAKAEPERLLAWCKALALRALLLTFRALSGSVQHKEGSQYFRI